MASILTNTSAMTALQTLRGVNAGLEKTQQQVSSGLRVQKASDNAAYWAISTTMRSDNRAFSAVSDAIELGSATVNTAYTATSSIVDILSEFKAKLVAAKENGVDKSKIQDELDQLNAQAETTVISASFSGQNWLSTNAPTHLMETIDLTTDVVSSFVRSENGAVAVATNKVNLKSTSMLNAGGGGILQKEIGGVGDIGGFRSTGINSVAHEGHESHLFTGPATFGVTDYITFDLVVDAGPHSAGVSFAGLRIDKSVIDVALGTTDGTIHDGAEMRKVLQKVFADNSVPATANETMFTGSPTAPGVFEVGSLETSGHPGSSIDISNVISHLASTYPAGFAMGLENPPNANHDNMYPEAFFDFTKPFTVSPKSQIFFDAQVGPGAPQSFTIDRTTVDAALGTTDGFIGNAADLATVIGFVTAGLGLSIVTSGNRLTFSADQTVYPNAGNRAARVMVGNVSSNPTWALEFDLAEVDVTSSNFTIDEYLVGIEYMLHRSTASGSVLGSLNKRLDMQSDFVSHLQASMTSGIGRLVDADMEEESARLAAQQTQQQLAVQALQIANTTPGTILQLYSGR
jgi:flagellin-like hook-associated protein FlgL